jgi:hypothetical protein
MSGFPRWNYKNQLLMALLFLYCLPAFFASAVTLPIIVDGLTGDWGNTPPAWTDPIGDNGTSSVDFHRLWLANDEGFIYLRFETGAEVLLNSNNNIVIYIDWDGQPSTGLNIRNIGADFKWEFGQRQGTTYSQSGSTTVYHTDLGFYQAPTVSSSQFEIAFSRNASVPVALGKTIFILFQNEGGISLDTLPDSSSISYTLSGDPAPPFHHIPIVKTNTADLRIMTYNTHNDSLFEKTDAYSRILNALGPDILNFQEIYNHTGGETATLISQILPPAPGEKWYYAQGADCVTISRFAILNTWNLDGNLASLIAAPESLPTSNILLINAHPPCCTDDSGRQLEIDHIMSFIRDAITAGGSVTLQKNTPVIIVGDMNFVGLSRQLKTLLTGDIVDESHYGTDFQPDWDATALSDCISTHNSSRAAYTWRSDTSDYPPGRLDYIIYTDSVIQTSHHFILWTPDMTPEELIQYGLNADDTPSASDHLPHVADFHTPLNLWMLW